MLYSLDFETSFLLLAISVCINDVQNANAQKLNTKQQAIFIISAGSVTPILLVSTTSFYKLFFFVLFVLDK